METGMYCTSPRVCLETAPFAPLISQDIRSREGIVSKPTSAPRWGSHRVPFLLIKGAVAFITSLSGYGASQCSYPWLALLKRIDRAYCRLGLPINGLPLTILRHLPLPSPHCCHSYMFCVAAAPQRHLTSHRLCNIILRTFPSFRCSAVAGTLEQGQEQFQPTLNWPGDPGTAVPVGAIIRGNAKGEEERRKCKSSIA